MIATISLSIKRTTKGKPWWAKLKPQTEQEQRRKNIEYYWFNRNWEPVDLTPQETISHYVKGFPLAGSQFTDGHKTNEKATCSGLFIFDYDLDCSDTKFTEFQQHPGLAHAFTGAESDSSEPDRRRLKLFVQPDQVITDEPNYPIKEVHPFVARKIAELYLPPGVDPASYDVNRAQFGGRPGRLPFYENYGAIVHIAPFIQAAHDEIDQRRAKQAKRAALPSIAPGDDHARAYLDGAINNILDTLNHAPANQGNAALYKASRALGGFAKTGYLAQTVFENILMGSEAAQRRPEREARATIASGFKRANPRHVPALESPTPVPGGGDLAAVPTDNLNYHKQISPDLPATTVPIELYHWPNGIPDKLREMVMGLHRDYAGYEDQTLGLVVGELLDEAIKAGTLDPQQPITVELLNTLAQASGRNTSETSIRRGLSQWSALGFLTRQDLPTGKKGRPIALYRIKPLAEALPDFVRVVSHQERKKAFAAVPDTVTEDWIPTIAPDFSEEQRRYAAEVLNADRADLYEQQHNGRNQAEERYQQATKHLAAFTLVNLLNCSSSKLDASDTWKNAREYRVSFYKARAAFRRDRGLTTTLSRAAAELGVSSKTASKIRQKAGYVADPIWDERPFDPNRDPLDQLPKYAQARNFAQCKLISDSGQEQWITPYNAAKVPRWAACEIEKGHSVKIAALMGSQERQATDAERAALEMERQQAQQVRTQIEHRATPASRPTDPRKRSDPLTGEIIENALKELIETPDQAWVISQLDLCPGWELLIEGIRLGAKIDLFKNLPGWEYREDHTNHVNLQINPPTGLGEPEEGRKRWDARWEERRE